MMRLLPLLVIVLLLPACGFRQDDAGGMDASVSLRPMHRCSRISPEIDIVNYPPQTAKFTVRLEDKSGERRFHGGGVWENDGSGIVPEGALTQHYIGPCPPVDGERPYEFIVHAIDASGIILAEKRIAFIQE